MTVTLHEEVAAGRRARNDRGVKTYTRQFQLSTSVQSEGPHAVGSHPSLPKIGMSHPENSRAKCFAIDIENSDPWKGWTAIYEYSTARDLFEDPLSDLAVITWNTEQFQRVAAFDNAGNAIVNSAGDPFDPPAMRDDSRRVVSITKNLAGPPVWILSYQDAVNSDTFGIQGVPFTAGQAKMQRVSIGELQERNDIFFYPVTFEIQLQNDGWDLSLLDAGFREIDGTDRIQILNSGDSESVNAPVALNGSGVALANPTAATCVFLDFSVYPALPFSILPLT